MKNLKIDCVCATSKKPRIAGLRERPGGVSAVGSLSCQLIERAILWVVRQIAGAKFAQKWLNGGLILRAVLHPTHPTKPHKPLHRRKHGGVFHSLQGVRVSRKEMRKAVAGFAGDQSNAMLALSEKERFFLSALNTKRVA